MTGLAIGLVAGSAFSLLAAALVWRRRALDAIHEIRRPLTGLLLIAESMRGALGPGELDALSGEVEAADGALERLSAIPGLARCSPGRRPARPVIGDLAGSVAAWNALARTCGRSVRLDGSDAAERLLANGSLRPAFSNLIANALEHSDGDVAVVAVEVEAGVEIRVDSGNAGDRAPQPAIGGSSAGRGRGTRIARRACRAAGASLKTDGTGGDGAAILIRSAVR